MVEMKKKVFLKSSMIHTEIKQKLFLKLRIVSSRYNLLQ